ncbi:hypothetical protein LR032_03890 [Candidatus Bipolaricaulota bacterium]|nr:hypothetical protein [Candidatus Bipolaricaulota bacterium]
MNSLSRRGIAVAWLAVLLAVIPVLGSGTSYDFTIELDLQERTLHGVVEVQFTATQPTAYFLLLANLGREENPFLGERAIDALFPVGFEPASTTIAGVDLVQAEGATPLPFRLISLPPAWQTYSLAETVLAVDLPPAGGETTVKIAFTTTIPRLSTGDQGIYRGVFTWRFGWGPLLLPQYEEWSEEEGVLLPPHGGEAPLRFPAATYSALIALPEGIVLASGADRVEKLPADQEGRSYYRLTNETPSRSLALVAGPDYSRFALDELPIPIEVFYLPGHGDAARLFATYARDILNDFQERFGPYPRARLTIVENPNRRGTAMAADGIVWLPSFFFSHRNITLPGITNRLAEFVLAHEIAHQWWGLSAGVDLNAQNWLSEGLAQYLAISYFEDRHGEFGPNMFEFYIEGILENLVSAQFGFFNLREHMVELPYLQQVEHGFYEAIIKPAAQVAYGNATVDRIYNKGFLVARTIAGALGRETFEKGLREAFLRFRGRTFDVDDLRAVLEEVSGQPLEELFDTWLFSAVTVDYAVEIVSRERTDMEHRTVVRVSREEGAVQPVVIKATLRDGETTRMDWDGAEAEGMIVFETEARVVRVTIDPDHLTLDRDRLNNHDPVKFVVLSGANAFPLDAYIIRPDPVSNGVTISYLDRLRLTISTARVSAEVRQGRNHRFFLEARLIEGSIAGTIGYTHRLFAARQTGSPGTFWVPEWAITISGHRLLTAAGIPLLHGHLAIVALPTFGRSRTSAVAIDLTADGAGRISVDAFDEVRLLPRIYLQGTIGVGTSFGDLPRVLRFDLDELMSFGTMRRGRFVRTQFLGEHKLSGRIAIEFPSPNDRLFNLANLMMVDRARMRLFVAGGTSWTNFDEFGQRTPNVEAGVEWMLDLSALGGLLPLRVIIGYATPLLGHGFGVFYWGFAL